MVVTDSCLAFFDCILKLYEVKFEPLIALPLRSEDFGAWRGMAILFSITLVVGDEIFLQKFGADPRRFDALRPTFRTFLLRNIFPSQCQKIEKGQT